MHNSISLCCLFVEKHVNMKITQFCFQAGVWEQNTPVIEDFKPNLVFCFGRRNLLIPEHLSTIHTRFPDAHLISSSTAGEINNEGIAKNSIVATALEFDSAKIQVNKVNIKDFSDSKMAGHALVKNLPQENLKLIFVLSDGQLVNGSDLLKGIDATLKRNIPVVGGLAGDGYKFQETLVGWNEDIEQGNIVAVGLYGDSLQIGYSSQGGWEAFGPRRTVTKAAKNVLYELDGQNALDLYKKYLGEYAAGLPGSALLFPLSVQVNEKQEPLVRTILSIDQETESMIFAGNIPEGSTVRLMRASIDNLVDAVALAAETSTQFHENKSPQLAILVSCVGRKIIFKNRIEEEWEEAKEVLENTVTMGFYSYGEISPALPLLNCQLYNQTMTITTISEKNQGNGTA